MRLAPYLIPALVASPLLAQGLSLESLFHPQLKVNYLAEPASQLSWLPDGQLLENRQGELSRRDPRTWKAEPFLSSCALKEALLKAGITEAAAQTASTKGPTLWTKAMDAFLVNLQGDFFYVKLDGLTLRRLSSDGAPKDAPTFSPDGTRLAYLRGNDLYAVELATARETRLTQGGSETRLNGRLDWVYDEEIYGRGGHKAFWWSPDSRRLAYLSLDVSREPVHMLLDDRADPQKQLPHRYPQPGDPNAELKLGVVDLQGHTTWMEEPQVGQEKLIVQVGWDPQGRLLASYQDRIQTWLELRRFQGTSSRLLLREQSPAWQDRLPLPCFLKDGSFLWLSDRTGFRHLYHCDAEGRVLGALTAGAWDVRTLHGVDEVRGQVFFSGTERSPIGLDAYSVALSGQGPNTQLKRLTQEAGTHGVQFNPRHTAFLDRWSDANTPARLSLCETSAKPRLIEDAATEALKALKLGTVKFQQVKNREGFPMESMLILPPDFDPAKKYPVFQEIYGGPHAPTVRNAWGRTQLWWHFLAQQGYVVWVCE